ncbi:MAG TPA: class I SAM-dependent methyltransferase [Streptosporangiaceae bacterium]|nr:class I SAM-dependent methyltransferase [Streptosporangiaceae bacterium]
MVDRLFAAPELAALYDLFCAWDRRDDLGFYLPMVMAAGSVLDVGCGTGMLLRRARQEGHAGRLCGLDPAAAMLAVARERRDIEWIEGDLSAAGFDRGFDLIVMTGHAFQVLTGDAELRDGLAAIADALAGNGRFAFETRNPAARGWEKWTPANAVEVADPAGGTWRQSHQVDLPVMGDLVSFTATYTGPGWDQPRSSRSTLRFLGAGALDGFLSAAGLRVEARYGDWDRGPLADVSPEIITIARPG